MKKSKAKLLLNAEPFGFGPSAAIATFFPYLRDRFEHLGYVGVRHTLDLQKDLAYDAIHDVSGFLEDEVKKVLGRYDIFFTALDFEAAALAKSLGLKVLIYDPLTWYWKVVPEVVRQSEMYLAQDFFGVKERLRDESTMFPSMVRVVPPIVSQKRSRLSRKYTLINLGGLQNPAWSLEDVVRYAKIFIQAITDCVSHENVIIATSNAIAVRLDDSRARNYNRAAMHDILENTKYAFMTPGLGNIYDAAKFAIPTVWLPPANDSQGQQLEVLRKHGLSDSHIDWADLGKPIRYADAQATVLENIKEAIYADIDYAMLRNVVRRTYEEIKKKDDGAAGALLDMFGVGGAEKISDIVFEYSQSL